MCVCVCVFVYVCVCVCVFVYIVCVYVISLYSNRFFLCTHIHSPFPTVADAVQSELEQYKQSEEEVKRLKDAMVTIYSTCICSVHVYTHMYMYVSTMT